MAKPWSAAPTPEDHSKANGRFPPASVHHPTTPLSPPRATQKSVQQPSQAASSPSASIPRRAVDSQPHAERHPGASQTLLSDLSSLPLLPRQKSPPQLYPRSHHTSP